MRKSVLFTISVLSLYAVLHSQANCVEKLNLKGGIVVEGHIVSQTLGESVTFSVERTYATINSTWLVRRTDDVIKTSELKDGWKTWADEQQEIRDKKEITLSVIKLANIETMSANKSIWQTDSMKAKILHSMFNGDSHKVYIYEEGAYLRFVDPSPNEHLFNLSDIYSIEYKEREATAINGIIDVVEVKSGEVHKGQILEKVIGNYTRIKTNDGKLVSILNKDIDSQKKEALNPDIPIFKQAEYLDEVNGTIGLIMYQNNNLDNPYILIQEENSHEKRIYLKDVKSIFSRKNIKYEPLNDIEINNNEIYFNRSEALPILCEKNKKGLFVLSNDSIVKMCEIDIEGNNKELVVEMANTESNKTVFLFPITKIKVDKQSVYAFSYEDVLDKSISLSREFISKNNTLRRVYIISKGVYALYVPKSGKFYFCKIS